MTAYFIRRFLLVIPTFIGITLLVFAITRFVPGGPIERMIAEAQRMQVEGGGAAGSGPVSSASRFRTNRSNSCGNITDSTGLC
jgi:ABC-type microcin C transport system permease subunit YejB